MAAPQPPARRRRRRPRRGSLERPVNGRLYRGAYLVAALPLLLLAFTVSSPSPLPEPALPETFDTPAAVALDRALASDYPDRAPGTLGAGDAVPLSGAAAWFEEQLRYYYRSELTARSWFEQLPQRGRVELTNIAAIVPGQDEGAIVVMAHRDDLGTGPGANENASGTAVLIELARAYAQPSTVAKPTAQPGHTLVFLSTDGDSFGGLGTLHFLRTWAARHPVVAVVNLDALGGSGAVALEIAGDRPRSPSPVLVATAAERVAEQTGSAPGHVGLIGQLIDLGFPLTLYDQGPFVAAGIPAVTITTGGDRPPDAVDDASIDAQRLGELGEASQELLGSLDQDVELVGGSSSYVWAGGRIFRGWAIELLLIALLAPFVVAVVDLYALCRRNRIALAPAARALRSRLCFWLFAGAVFTCFRLLGAWPSGPARPPDPADPVSTRWPGLTLVALALLLVAGWAVGRQRLAVRRRVSAEEQVAGYLVALVTLFLVALLVAATNPFALLFLLPALHVWLWLPQLRIARAPVRLALFLAGLTGPGLVLASLAWRFRLGLNAPWYLLQLVANGYVSTLAVVITLTGAAAAAQLAAISAGRYAPYPSASERGPRGPLRELVRMLVLTLGPGRRPATARGAGVGQARGR